MRRSQFDGFVYPAVNQIISQLAKYRHRSGGTVAMPVVIRIPYGGGIGSIEHHSESTETYWVHTAGLKVVTCSSAHDAYTMIRQAIADDDPVVFLEPKRRYWNKAEVNEADETPMDRARVLRPGTDATIICYGPTVATALEAADIAAQEGRELEVIDLRSLSPLDTDTVRESVIRTGRALVVHEAALSHEARSRDRRQDPGRGLLLPAGTRHPRNQRPDTPYPPSSLEEDLGSREPTGSSTPSTAP